LAEYTEKKGKSAHFSHSRSHYKLKKTIDEHSQKNLPITKVPAPT
jgi:hypothetical protein